MASQNPGTFFLHSLEENLRSQLQNWFSVGFVEMKEVTWNSPASLLERIIKYEAVHAIEGWASLKQRLVGPGRRCFGFFHASMEDEPLVFVEVALVDKISTSIQEVLQEDKYVKAAEAGGAQSGQFSPSTAIFYSISSTQAGLSGVDLGNFLIKQVVHRLHLEYPSINTFSTLSPLPGFLPYLFNKIGKVSSFFFFYIVAPTQT